MRLTKSMRLINNVALCEAHALNKQVKNSASKYALNKQCALNIQVRLTTSVYGRCCKNISQLLYTLTKTRASPEAIPSIENPFAWLVSSKI